MKPELKKLLGCFLLGCCQHLADGGPLLLGECFGRELPERLFQIVRILGLEDHDVVRRLGGLILAQGEVHAVLFGAGLERPDVRFRDFKAKDADNLEQALREFTAKTLSKEQRPSIRKVLTAAKQKAAQQPKRAKEKIKQRGLER